MAGNQGVNSLPNTFKSDLNGLMALVETSFEGGKDCGEGIFYKDTTENYVSKIQEVGTSGSGFALKRDGQASKQSEISEGFNQVFTQAQFSDEFPLGYQFRKFQSDMLNAKKLAAKKLGRNGRRFDQRMMFSHFNYAFDTTNTYLGNVLETTVSAVGPDGKKLASTVHPVAPGSSTTYSNVLSASNPVGEEALKLMLQNVYDQKDEEGEKLYYGADDSDGFIWCVPGDQLDEALRVIGSDRRSGVSDNDANVYKGEDIYKGKYRGSTIEVREIPWMGEVSTTAHCLVAKASTDDMIRVFLEADPFQVEYYDDERTMTDYVRAHFMRTSGFVSGRGICLSKGDGSTYTD